MTPEQIQQLIRQEVQKAATANRFQLSGIPRHVHNFTDSPQVAYPNLTNRTRFILARIVSAATATTTGTAIGGAISMPFGGTIVQVGATVDTAGVTGNMTINVLLNGTTILGSDITIATTAKTSRPNYPAIVTPNFTVGDLLTFNVDAVQTTPALGLTVFLRLTEITP